MKRVLVGLAFIAALVTGATGTALAAPEPEPTPTAVEPSPSGVDPNTAQVCQTSRETIVEGMQAFSTELDEAVQLAIGDDLSGAAGSVKQAGLELVDLASQLRTDAEQAQNAELKQALDAVAEEFRNLGASLTSIASMQDFSIDRLEVLAKRVSELCAGA